MNTTVNRLFIRHISSQLWLSERLLYFSLKKKISTIFKYPYVIFLLVRKFVKHKQMVTVENGLSLPLIRLFQWKHVRRLYYASDIDLAWHKGHDYACETTPAQIHAQYNRGKHDPSFVKSLVNRKREERFIFIFVWRALNENGSRRLCSFALLLFISLPKWCCSCRYKRRDTTRDRTYTWHRDALRLYISYHPSFSLPYRYLFIFENASANFCTMRVDHRLTRKRSPGYFSTLPRVTSKKFRPVKKETGMSSYLDTGLVNIRHVAKGNRGSRAYTHVRRDAIVSGPGLRQNSLTELGLRLIVSGERERRREGGGGSVERRKRGQIQGKGQKGWSTWWREEEQRRKGKERVKEQKEQSDLLKRNAWELNHVARGLVREISHCESTCTLTEKRKLSVYVYV